MAVYTPPTAEEVLAEEARSMGGDPPTLVDASALGGVQVIVYDHRSHVPGELVIVTRRIAIRGEETRASLIAETRWETA
jgi:hypothetical protein